MISNLPPHHPSFHVTWDMIPPHLRQQTLVERTARIVYDILRGLVVFWVLAQVLKPLIRIVVLPASYPQLLIGPKNIPQLRKDCLQDLPNQQQDPMSPVTRTLHTTTVCTPDGAELDVLVVKYKDDPNTPWILSFNPNGAAYAWYNAGENPELPPMMDLTEKPSPLANLVFFDYRGVGVSKGCISGDRDLYIDGASMVQYMKRSLGVQTVHQYGHSLGGVVSLFSGADGVQISDRSPASVDAFLKAHVGDWLGAFGSYLASLAGFELNAKDQFCQLSRPKLATWHAYDQVVKPEAALAVARGVENRLTLPSEFRNNAHCDQISSFEAGQSVLTFLREHLVPQH